MLMDTRQLAAFCAVVEKKSFSQAAERLGVTQPAVSLQIRALEKRLRTVLLDPSRRPGEARRAGASGPLGPPGRADGIGPSPLPERPADALARGAAARGALPGGS